MFRFFVVFSIVVTVIVQESGGVAVAGPFNEGGAFGVWPETGQSRCYDAGGNIIHCPAEGAPFYGQDGNCRGPARSYTKLDGTGSALPDNASSWSMVRDNVTGLVWEVKDAKDLTPDYANPHDADNTYTWCNSDAATNGGVAGTCGTNNTEEFIAALNKDAFGGYSDWRLPTLKELVTLVDYGQGSSKFGSSDPSFFPNTRRDAYWSGTTRIDSLINPSTNAAAWYLEFAAGTDNTSGKSTAYFVRAVRGGKVAGGTRFVDLKDGTVLDSFSGLQWQQAGMDLDGDGTPDPMSWEQALAACDNLNLGGHTDWRLPNILELRSIVDYGSKGPAIDTSVFAPQVTTSSTNTYWSSTTTVDDTTRGWNISFFMGYDSDFADKETGLHLVRAVRGGGGECVPYSFPWNMFLPAISRGR